MLRPIRFAALFLVLASPLAAQLPQQTGAEERPVSGAYTEAQATRGDTAFQLFCASCHEQSSHTGDKFRENWYGRTLGDLFRALKTTMPDDNPGGLTDDQYLTVIAYIMRLNGFTPGPDSLVADTVVLKRIRIAAPAAAPASPSFSRDTAARKP